MLIKDFNVFVECSHLQMLLFYVAIFLYFVIVNIGKFSTYLCIQMEKSLVINVDRLFVFGMHTYLYAVEFFSVIFYYL
jgi:hypothetical protein